MLLFNIGVDFGSFAFYSNTCKVGKHLLIVLDSLCDKVVLLIGSIANVNGQKVIVLS
jgi:hypothetical protein